MDIANELVSRIQGIGNAAAPIPPRPQTPLSGSTLLPGQSRRPFRCPWSKAMERRPRLGINALFSTRLVHANDRQARNDPGHITMDSHEDWTMNVPQWVIIVICVWNMTASWYPMYYHGFSD
jgi:hypothetical protein